MRKLFVVLALLSVIGCGKETNETKLVRREKVAGQPADMRNAKIKETLPIDEMNVVERSAMGSRVAPDGTVAESQDVFKPGEPVYVTMWLKASPNGLQTSVRFTDAKGKEAGWPRMEMKGAKVATFKLDTRKLAPGEYKAECFWGMNSEREYAFKIEKKK